MKKVITFFVIILVVATFSSAWSEVRQNPAKIASSKKAAFEKILKESIRQKMKEDARGGDKITIEFKKFIIEDVVKADAKYGDSWVPRGYTIFRANIVNGDQKMILDFERWFYGLFSVDGNGNVQEIKPPILYTKDNPNIGFSKIRPAKPGEIIDRVTYVK